MIGIKNQRQKAGITMTELAQKLDVTANTIWRWENAKYSPNVEKLKRMSNLFGCTIDELVNDSEANPTLPAENSAKG